MKTAVDCIEETMLYKQLDYQEFSMLIREAKNIERENIEAAYEDGFHNGSVINQLHNLPEQYYEDNYNNINYIDEPKNQKSDGKNI